jgi:glycine cleavage system aminomethyltransferase T
MQTDDEDDDVARFGLAGAKSAEMTRRLDSDQDINGTPFLHLKETMDRTSLNR